MVNNTEDSINVLQDIGTTEELKKTERIQKNETKYVIGSYSKSTNTKRLDPQIRDLEKRLSAQSQKISELYALQDEILKQLRTDEEHFQEQITTLLRNWTRIARAWQTRIQEQKGEISQLAQAHKSIIDILGEYKNMN